MPYVTDLPVWHFHKAMPKIATLAGGSAQGSPMAEVEEQYRGSARAHGKTTFEVILQGLLWNCGCDCVDSTLR